MDPKVPEPQQGKPEGKDNVQDASYEVVDEDKDKDKDKDNKK